MHSDVPALDPIGLASRASAASAAAPTAGRRRHLEPGRPGPAPPRRADRRCNGPVELVGLLEGVRVVPEWLSALGRDLTDQDTMNQCPEADLKLSWPCSRSWRLTSGAGQRRDALEVARLREHVEGLDARDAVAGGGERHEVAHLRLGVARDVDDRARREGHELGQELRRAALAGRIDDDGGVGAREGAGPRRSRSRRRAMNVQLSRPLRAAFSRAQATLDGLTSTPKTRSKPGAAASASRPLPQ